MAVGVFFVPSVGHVASLFTLIAGEIVGGGASSAAGLATVAGALGLISYELYKDWPAIALQLTQFSAQKEVYEEFESKLKSDDFATSSADLKEAVIINIEKTISEDQEALGLFASLVQTLPKLFC